MSVTIGKIFEGRFESDLIAVDSILLMHYCIVPSDVYWEVREWLEPLLNRNLPFAFDVVEGKINA